MASSAVTGGRGVRLLRNLAAELPATLPATLYRLVPVMGLKSVWKNYKVLIVMGTGLGVVHWGWYRMQSNPIFIPQGEDRVPSVFRFLSRKFMDSRDK